MALEHWSSTASGNASPPSINFAEGQAPSTLNNSSREMMAQLRAKYYATEWVWVKNSATASVATQTTIKVAGNQIAQFEANRRIRLTGGSTTVYGSIVSASYTTETTVTLTPDSGSLSASMSVVAISAVDQNATPAAAAVAYLTSNSASIMIAAVGMPSSGGLFTGPVGHSATASFSGIAQFNSAVSISGAVTVYGALTHKGSASFSNSVHFRAPVEFSNTASFNAPVHFKGSASFSASVHFRGGAAFNSSASFSTSVNFEGAVNVHSSASFSGSVNFLGSTNFLSSASFSGSVNFARSINVSATASVGALTIAGTAFTGPGMVLLGSKSTWPATEIKFSGSWSDYPVMVLTGTIALDNNGTAKTGTVTIYTDGGTTGFLSLGVASVSLSAAHIEARIMGNGASVKAIAGGDTNTATYTANSGFINAMRIAFNTSPTVSGGVAYLFGWKS